MFLIALLLGTLIRFISINQSLWLDEAITANTAINLDFQDILFRFSPHDFHPPFYYFFINIWGNLFGYTPLVLRLPSVIFSLLSALLVYKIALQYFPKSTSAWVSVFFYFNPLIVYYSQEVRMYSLVVLLFCLLFYAVVTTNRFLIFIAAFLSLFTFYGSVFYIIPFIIYLFFKKQWHPALILLASCFFFLAVIFPLLIAQITNSRQLLASVPSWTDVLGKFDLKNLLMIHLKLTSGRISFLPKANYYLFSVSWLLVLSVSVIKSAFRLRFFTYMIIAPVICASIFALVTSGGLQYFRLLFLAVPLALLLAHALTGYNLLKLTYLSVFFGFCLYYLLNVNQHREDWAGLLNRIPPSMDVYMIKSFSDPVLYYRPDLQIKDISEIPASGDNLIYVIPYGESIHGQSHLELLSSYKPYYATSSNNVSLEVWTK